MEMFEENNDGGAGDMGSVCQDNSFLLLLL
jgi:hypothetical protein